MGGFPSGQRGQTVNLLSTTSVVRIHHLPPKKRVQVCALFCFARRTKQARIRANWKSHVSWFQPSLSLRDISPEGRDKFGLCETKAFLPEEGGTAQAVTEGAARGQVCIRANDREGSTLANSYQDKLEKPCQLVPALSVAARHLSRRERQGGLRVRQKIRTGFSALPLGELAFAKQMTERAKANKFVSGQT